MMNSTIQTNIARLQIMKAKVLAALRKGENYELKTELNSEYKERRKEAVRRVIANMTVGKDVSGLFTDVLKNMHTDDLEIKKLIYLYLINYAKTQPDLVILAINTFVKDAEDTNPLIRALAIRTMGCLHVEEVLDYLCDPLHKCLKDTNPYVRKTAVMCVAKVYDLSVDVAEDNGFVESVREALSDSNSMVVSNAVSALVEMNDMSPHHDVWRLDANTVGKLLTAINECIEWGQIAILETLVDYTPRDEKEAENICERLLPRLQHANGSVVLTTVRLLLKYEKHVHRADLLAQFSKKMVPPLITLLSSDPEIQYVALRNINIILQRHPKLLSKEIRVFFCRYNDPIYVKYEKLDVLVRICSERNTEPLLNELKEYAKEVDMDFVSRAVQAISRLAIRYETAAEKAIKVLLELLETRANHIVQSCMVALQDILRRYPRCFDSLVDGLCEYVDDVNEPEARAALIWILGEYSESVTNISNILTSFLESFLEEEDSGVQLALINATVKFFLKSPQQGQTLVLKALQTATEKCANPDVRDRAYIYWRLLSADPNAARAVALTEKPAIELENVDLSPQLLEELVNELGCVSSVLQKPARLFVYSLTEKAGVPRDSGISAMGLDDADNVATGAGDGAGSSPAGIDVSNEGEPELLISF
ncbi:AP-2 complex subunit beta-like protein [Kickxella alabastrina]|uniref:AP-2 complex subunit beta-like protein n=1 Tax=Kickxella alabastrina TaxID=61397 RepID=UPI00221EB804|nr:AP-2 complex subunit beta-like protein [Kickxella alabastrina]KAI7833144.1 AP-2 complex subunit beta-like protein [Kickxella alabastrina]